VVDILIINMPELIQNYLFLTLHATCTYGNNLEAWRRLVATGVPRIVHEYNLMNTVVREYNLMNKLYMNTI